MTAVMMMLAGQRKVIGAGGLPWCRLATAVIAAAAAAVGMPVTLGN